MAPDVDRTEEEWKEQLSPEQYEILRRKGTEPPFTGKFTFNKDTGMYRCAGCGADLFHSDTKYDSGSGWPSFTDPANNAHVELNEDHSHGMVRTEVTCKRCGGHLGHLFDDGPGPNGKRFCINSCALEFDPLADEKVDEGTG